MYECSKLVYVNVHFNQYCATFPFRQTPKMPKIVISIKLCKKGTSVCLLVEYISFYTFSISSQKEMKHT